MNRVVRHARGAAPTALWLTVWTYLYLLAVLAAWVAITSLATGWRPVVITGGSMAPALRSGDVVMMAEPDPDLLSQRALVTYLDDSGRRVTHRVFALTDDGVITRGDANVTPDPAPVPPARIDGVGRLVVPFVGLPLSWWTNGHPMLVVAWLAATTVAAVLALRRTRGWRRDERTRRRPATEVTQRAVRRVRVLVAVMIAAQFVIEPERFRIVGDVAPPVVALVGALGALIATNLLSWRSARAGREDDNRIALLELVLDTALVVALTTATGNEGVGWVLFAMPVVEAAARFRLAGALAHWLVLTGSTVALRIVLTQLAGEPGQTLLQDLEGLTDQLSVLLLVVIPAAHLAEQLITDVLSQRRATQDAARRNDLLHEVVDLGGLLAELNRSLSPTLADAALRLGFEGADVIAHRSGRTDGQVLAATSALIDRPLPPPGAPASGMRDVDLAHPAVVVDGDDDDASERAAWQATGWGSLVRLTVAGPDDTSLSMRVTTAGGTPPDADAVDALRLLLGQAIIGLQNRGLVQQLRALHSRVRHEADHDALTGLPNRAHLLRGLEEASAAATPDGWTVVLFLDLNGFKPVNDRLGHEAGDELLRAVAARLRSRLPERDLVARLGGDEFTVVVRDLPHPDLADDIATRVRDGIREPFEISGEPVRISTSVGIASSAGETTAPELLRRADVAMYHAKRVGSTGIAHWTEELDHEEHRKGRLQTDLDDAMANGALALHYQPIVTAHDTTTVGVEALLRWHHPEIGPVPPNEVLTAAQQSGRAAALRRWILTRACRDIQALQTQYRNSTLFVTVNVSTVDAADPLLADDVLAALATTGLAAEHLLLELSERLATDDIPALVATLRRLAAAGVRVLLDDFGEGRTSLIHLRRLPMAGLKLDRSLVVGAEDGTQDRIVLHAIVQLAHELGIVVVAEGIETDGQAALCRQAGIDLLQGYRFGRATPVADHATVPAGGR